MKKQKIGGPAATLLILAGVIAVLFIGWWLMRPKMPEVPPELQDRQRPSLGGVQGGSGQPTGRMGPGRAPD
ncbi:MAG: hypothetical protein IT210_06165 [Armatimonadetes bacterium]|nr:hypothetical protein [Armatimonadota bacterium]